MLTGCCSAGTRLCDFLVVVVVVDESDAAACSEDGGEDGHVEGAVAGGEVEADFAEERAEIVGNLVRHGGDGLPVVYFNKAHVFFQLEPFFDESWPDKDDVFPVRHGG